MTIILLKAFALVLIGFLGYILKTIGFFAPNDYKLISKIVLNITLPAALITSFADFTMNLSLLFVILLGLVCNLIPMLWGLLLSTKRDSGTKAFYMLNISGLNIGAFTLPFVQSFLSLCHSGYQHVNTGNSIMTTGGTYLTAQYFSDIGERGNLHQILKS